MNNLLNGLGLRAKKNGTGKKSQYQTLYLTSPYVNNMLVKGSFKTIVVLPKYVDPNEWLAYNAFEFFNYSNLFYGSISDFCTPQNCPTMSGGLVMEYTWTDATRKATKLSAPVYVDCMTTWIQNLLTDENVFPTKAGSDFPPDFLTVIKSIFRELVRLFVHIYHHHYTQVLCLYEEAHFNSLFAHFISFAMEFDLLDKKDTAPLQDLIEIMEGNNIISA
ncbi:Mob1/phocein [Jimgerdemannia flammicorona]|uniref:Mob1/phocein n=1 Tax=Jimgerdemannia flammicorona TaxID=994334 RepID=A0A433QM14_9FUNG|nr:Mob1/phocein [Jimgerdemannia flammicorona]